MVTFHLACTSCCLEWAEHKFGLQRVNGCCIIYLILNQVWSNIDIDVVGTTHVNWKLVWAYFSWNLKILTRGLLDTHNRSTFYFEPFCKFLSWICVDVYQKGARVIYPHKFLTHYLCVSIILIKKCTAFKRAICGFVVDKIVRKRSLLLFSFSINISILRKNKFE